eukprot:TRINITY_DN2809_c0_g2_i1.p1 TRINITY_DN2809_c0_g2~~TRINITY_DN2809_c0_g2_i1.p1  ORF type:complete len:435 (+),score=86.42 TRINITY_DN2809_c0_g2_i1:210-1514(+)
MNTYLASGTSIPARLTKRPSFVIKTQRAVEIPSLSSDEEEEEEEYKKGGYHPVEIADVFNNRYTVEAKLGWGHFSTVWRARDNQTSQEVAIKIVKSARHYIEAARDEITILKTVTKQDRGNLSCVAHLIDYFDIVGPNGTHVAMVFEKLGCNLLTLIRMYKYRGLPVPLVKVITKQMIIGMEFLHKCLIIHTDLKPENLLLLKTPKVIKSMTKDERDRLYNLKRPENRPSDDDPRKGLPWNKMELLETFGDESYRVKIVDLGNACWTYQHFTDDVQTRQYRAPEVILGMKYDLAIDVWSMACIVFELLTGDLLFEPKAGRTFEKNDDHLAQISELVGPFPLSMTVSGKYSQHFFTPNGELKAIKNLKLWGIHDVLRDKYKFSTQDSREISEFLLPMLSIDPVKRATAKQCLADPWIQLVDVDNFEKVLDDCGWD